MSSGRRTAINPLPWILQGMEYRLDRSVLLEAMREVADVGFTHMTIELPSDMPASEYGAMLADHGLSAAPGYFGAHFHDRETHSAVVEQIRRHAAAQLELGVDIGFIAGDLIPDRVAAPAIGTNPDQERTLIIAEGLAAAAEAAAAEGVRYGLHPHVGSPVETESEVRAVLDATQGSALWFGPDTGHLFWGGAVPQTLIGDYSDRVLAIHLKDANADAIDRARALGHDYSAATGQAQVWREPGLGDVDLDAVLEVLPSDFDGWSVIEVDVPFVGTPKESSAKSFEYLQKHPFFAAARTVTTP
ncbi:MAG: sugar phosphate isomerase/epimerase family protein [Pseudoclavibacter sp.]